MAVQPTILIDGNNLGHALGYIDKATDHYDQAGLLSRLDNVARRLAAQGQPVEMVLFFDDIWAEERLGGWRVQGAPVPDGDADAAIRAYAQAHADRAQILVSGDRALCGDVSLWGVVCLSPQAFVSRYSPSARSTDANAFRAKEPSPFDHPAPVAPMPDRSFQGVRDRQRQVAALARAEAMLRGETLSPPKVFRLDLARWSDPVELALYLSENHLCPAHADLTTPAEMIAAIRDHCCRQPRYFTAGRIIDRVFRLFLCRPEHTLTLDDLTRLSQTRRRKKVRAALLKYGGRLGIQVAW